MKRHIFIGIVVLLMNTYLTSCGKKEIVQAPYPEAKVYLPQAAQARYNMGGLYQLPANVYNQPVNYVIENGKVNIPIGVLRTGAHLSGSVQANLTAAGVDSSFFTALPSDAFTLAQSVTIADGALNATAILGINTDFLINSFLNTPARQYGLRIRLSSANMSINNDLGTFLLIVSPQSILKASADFYAYTYNDNSMTAYVINKSVNGYSYAWDFGDNTEILHTPSPPPHVYKNKGTYLIKLTASASDARMPSSTKEISITIL